MTMTSRERLLAAMAHEFPDRLPCQVHDWMDFYLKHYLGGMDAWQAYERFDMDYAIFVSPNYNYASRDLEKWQVRRTDLGTDDTGNHRWLETITTPKGDLRHAGAWNEITPWETEFLIKDDRDFELWREFCPLPVSVDLSPVIEAKKKLGEKGILRSGPFSPGQGSPWQSFCTLVDTEKAIFMAMDRPDFLHYALESILQRTLKVMPMWEGTPADLVETGGGAGSSTVISPKLFAEFCLPYDQRQNRLLHDLNLKVIYHLCGGLMPMLDLVVQTGADGLETMTPPEMGGDCDLMEASRRVGDRLFLIGGFDQNAGFENGVPQKAREQVRACFEATREHAGYICCPSDHFFHGDPACLQAFADEAKQCVY